MRRLQVKEATFLRFSSLWCQSANPAPPSLPTSSSFQLSFSCCNYSSRTAGNILLMHPPKKKKLRQLTPCRVKLSPRLHFADPPENSLPPSFLITLTPLFFHDSPTINPSLRSSPPFSLSLSLAVSRPCLVVLFSGQDLSSSVRLQSATPLCRLFREANNDIPNPADL